MEKGHYDNMIVNSLYKGIQWYNDVTASDVAMTAIAVGGNYCHRQDDVWCHICISQGVSNDKPRNLTSLDG